MEQRLLHSWSDLTSPIGMKLTPPLLNVRGRWWWTRSPHVWYVVARSSFGGFVVLRRRYDSQHEAGELIAAGLTETDLVELGQLYDYAGEQTRWTPKSDVVKDIRASGDVTIFKSVGVGVQDVVIACAVVQRAMEEGIGHVIEDYDE